MPDLISVTNERRIQIAEAIEKGQEVVYVKMYPESTYGYLTLYNVAHQDEFSNDCAVKYYGIRILIDEEE